MNYLRTHRLKTALNQEEVALLLGLDGGATVSRHESGERTPELARALAYSALYGAQVKKLFREEYRREKLRIKSMVLKLAEELKEELPSATRDRKLAVLEGLLDAEHLPAIGHV